MSDRMKKITWHAVRPIFIAVPVLTVAAAIWYFLSRPESLPPEEARALLADATIEGGWGEEGTSYRQYFGEQGDTTYAPATGMAAEGSWRVEADGTVCTALPGQDERCNAIGEQEGVFYWIDGGRGLGFPFKVQPGRQIPSAAAASGGQG